MTEHQRLTYSVDFIQGFPLFVRHPEALRRLDRSFHLTGPNFQIFDLLFFNEFPQTFGILDW